MYTTLGVGELEFVFFFWKIRWLDKLQLLILTFFERKYYYCDFKEIFKAWTEQSPGTQSPLNPSAVVKGRHIANPQFVLLNSKIYIVGNAQKIKISPAKKDCHLSICYRLVHYTPMTFFSPSSPSHLSKDLEPLVL